MKRKFNKEKNSRDHMISVRIGSEKDMEDLLKLEFNLPGKDDSTSPIKYMFTKTRNLMEER